MVRGHFTLYFTCCRALSKSRDQRHITRLSPPRTVCNYNSKVTWICILLCHVYSRLHLESAQVWPVCNKGITQFSLPTTDKPYLPLLPSRKASPPFSWYSLHLPTKEWPGWVGLGGLLHTEINVPHLELNPNTVTHPSTNRRDVGWLRWSRPRHHTTTTSHIT